VAPAARRRARVRARLPRKPQTPYVARLFGARDVALAAGAPMSEAEAGQLGLRLDYACDAADAAAGFAAASHGYLGPAPAAHVSGAAVGAAALGAAAMRAAGTA